jgi:hypothetical protein
MAVYSAQENSPSLEHCVLMTRCEPSGKVIRGSRLEGLIDLCLCHTIGLVTTYPHILATRLSDDENTRESPPCRKMVIPSQSRQCRLHIPS